MRIVSADLAVFDPEGTARWYRESLGAVGEDAAAVRIGGTRVRFHPRVAPAGAGRNHLAFRIAEERLGEALSTARSVGTHLPGEDRAAIQDWPFLSARAVYLVEPRGDILELIAPAVRTGDAHPPPGPLAEEVAEVGLLVADAAEAAALLAATGLPVLGEPTAEFGFVGDLEARLVLTTPGRPWFPTRNLAASETILAVEVADAGVTVGAEVRLGPILVRITP